MNIAQSDRSQKILITGATGLIGRSLVPALLEAGHQLTVVSRRPNKAASLGDALRVVGSISQLPASEHVDLIIHLAGEPVAAKLWTTRRKQELLRSRGQMPAEIGAWIANATHKPDAWLNASAIGWYGTPDDIEQTFTEQDSSGEGFAAVLCRHIEDSAQSACDSLAPSSRPRLVQLRIGLVLAAIEDGGYLSKLALPVKLMLGSVLGNGRQWQSWIHIDDVVNAILHCAFDTSLDNKAVAGAVNLTSPSPARAGDLMHQLGAALNRPVFLKVPAFLLRLVASDMADDLLLASQRVLPQRLLDRGFSFAYAELPKALHELLTMQSASGGGKA